MIRRMDYFVLAALLLAITPVSAGVGFQTPTAEELAMTSEPLAPGAPAIILYRQVDRVETYYGHEDNYVRVKILTEEGRKYGDVEIPFFEDNGRIHQVGDDGIAEGMFYSLVRHLVGLEAFGQMGHRS